MKKITAILSAVIIVFSSLGLYVNAKNVNYEQPFASGVCGSETFRIPAIITLNDGSVMAAADMRYAHGTDSPNNIDTLVAVSENGLDSWQYSKINYFDDYSDDSTDSESASFIDSALVQSKNSGRIFILTDAFPSGMGYNQAEKGTGYVKDSSGKLRLALTSSDSSKIKNYEYYLGDFENGFAPVLSKDNKTDYSVDEEFNLYKNNEAIYIQQKNSDKMIKQNIFYNSSDYHVFPTSYLWLRYSDDNGKSWSAPQILNSQVKDDKEAFLGVGPGRGFCSDADGERIIFTVYDNKGLTEKTSTIYSDDNGATWHRGERVKNRIAVGKTSESQIVKWSDGTLHLFSRNTSDFVAESVSTDNGISWSRAKAVEQLSANGNCMVSFINYSGKRNGGDVVLGSFASDNKTRSDGVIKVGIINSGNEIEWISTYNVNDGFFAYSCLTELSDGSIAYLYEDEAAHIEYKILTISDDVTLSEINGNNIEYNEEKAVSFIKKVFRKIAFFLHIL